MNKTVFLIARFINTQLSKTNKPKALANICLLSLVINVIVNILDIESIAKLKAKEFDKD